MIGGNRSDRGGDNSMGSFFFIGERMIGMGMIAKQHVLNVLS